jgi:hypothetical protein
MKIRTLYILGVILFATYLTGCGGGGGGTSNSASQQSDTAPTVVSTFPAVNSGAVAMNTAITVTFSEAIDPATINAQSFTLTTGGVPVAGSVTYFGTMAVFRPDANLLANASYSATITTGVKDLAGNALAANASWNFTTGSAPDTAFPVVQTFSPPAGATNVPVDAPITVSFDEPIMPFVYGQVDGRPIAVSFNATYTIATMKPTVPLLHGATYTTAIRLKDMAGNQMPAVLSWQFTTIP